MPWKGLRSNAAGGRKSRRHSVFDNAEAPAVAEPHGMDSAEAIVAPADIMDHKPMSRQSSHAPSRNPAPPAHDASQADHATEDSSHHMRRINAATVPKSHRFSLLRFRHASDPQLSSSYSTSALILTPPLPKPPTPTIITTAPTTSPVSRNGKFIDRLKLPGRSENSSTDNVTLNHHRLGAALDEASQQSSAETSVSKSRRDIIASHPHISFEEPSRLSTLSIRGAPPAYGEMSSTSLSLPASRLSESSRSDESSADHGIYAETTTTHTVSTTTTFFRLPRRRKDKGHLFPLPVKIPPPDSNMDGIRTPRFSRSGRPSISPVRSPHAREPVTAIFVPERQVGTDSEHPSPLPSPTRSAQALTNAPYGSPGPSVFRKDSVTSHRSANSTPSIPMPPLLGSRGRSSTMGSLKRTGEADRQPSPQIVPAGRASTSTSGRKSFGDLFSLSHRLRQNSEPSNFGNGKTLSGTPGTPASTGSKSNSFQIPREPVVYPERAEGDTPATYLAKLEEAANRGVIAAILCKGFDDFSKTCLRKYMRGFSYFSDSIDMAVRKMLMEVELPKETQQIDRLLQGFADRYCECNPGIFVSTDEAYFVAFSILLLHSDTHNKNNKRKMQKQDYVKNTQDQVEVSRDILECFYDNVSYTPFIHFEDEIAINSHRLAAPKAKKGLFKTPSTDILRGPVDPYALILDQKLELLRPSLKDVMDTEDTYSSTGTVSTLDANILYHAFHKAGVLQIVSARSRPDAFLSQATISNPAEAQVGLVDIKAAKVGLLWRKDPKKKKARSPWQEWGALLTGSQLYFFRDVAWVKSLISQNEAHQRSGPDTNPIVFKPPLASFQPDALLSMDDAVALLDAGYKKHKNAFLFVKHGGFEEVFLANNEADMNDWIAKLNYAATFRTVGVRMRGFIGANYEGQRPDLGRNDSASSMRSMHTARGDMHTHGRQINHQLAGEILAYRRQIMTDKITEADEKLATTQKELDNLLRNARHLQICSPIQAKTREALVLAAGRMSAKLKWTRVEMWRTRCHRDVMKMDLEQEIGTNSAASILRESVSLRSTPQKKTPLKLSSQSLKKPEIKGPDAASSPKSTFSMLSSQSTSRAVQDKLMNPENHSHTFSDDSVSHDGHLSVGSLEHSLAASENPRNLGERTGSSSNKSVTSHSLDHRPSISSSHFGRSDADSIGPTSRLTTPAPSIGDEERLLREAGLIDAERTAIASLRPDTSESDRDLTITSPETSSKDRAGPRRSLHRSLRDSQHMAHTSQSLRLRKGKEPPIHSSPAAALRRNSQNGTEGLSRGTGSFTVHGKKASVVTFGSEWHSMSNEDRMKLRKQVQADSPEGVAEADTRVRVLLSPKAEEDEDEDQDTTAREAVAPIDEIKDMIGEVLRVEEATKTVVSPPDEEEEEEEEEEKEKEVRDATIHTSSKSQLKASKDSSDTDDDWASSDETFTHLVGSDSRNRTSSRTIFESEINNTNTTMPGHLSIPSSADLKRSPTPQAIHA